MDPAAGKLPDSMSVLRIAVAHEPHPRSLSRRRPVAAPCAAILRSVSQEYVELIRQGYEAWNSGDRRWVLDHMVPEVEWVAAPEDPDPGVYRGYEGVERFWAQWRAAVGQLRFDPLEFIDAGDDVVVIARRSGRGEQSGVDVADTIAQVFSFGPGGKCYRVREFADREEALRAVAPAA